MERKKINHDTLTELGFGNCIFAPIYISKPTYYIGKLDFDKEFMNDVNWGDAKMLLAVSSDGETYINYSDGERFAYIDEIVEYCKTNEIEITT